MRSADPDSRALSPPRRQPLDRWSFCSTEAGAIAVPDALSGATLAWREVSVPCTVASALREGSGTDVDVSDAIDERDAWFRCEFGGVDLEAGGVELVLHGLATICEIWLNGTRLGDSSNMFVRTGFDVRNRLSTHNVLLLCFRALGPRLRERHPRARWRTQLVAERHLRFYRTSLLGRMSSWCPPAPAVGPWRPVELVLRPDAGIHCEAVSLDAVLDEHGARLDVEVEVEVRSEAADREGLRIDAARFAAEVEAEIEIEGGRWPLAVEALADSRVRLTGTPAFPESEIEPWWPHTHGAPRRYAVTLRARVGGFESRIELGRVGFRRVEIAGPPGPAFGLVVNGVRVFCRGTCWMPIDALALEASREEIHRALEQARDAGINLLRVAGPTIYESDSFYELCDELGILVWQDFMFATLDYPDADAAWMDSVCIEADQFLTRTRSRACLAVLCGNGEGQQQPAMLGLEAESASSLLFDEVLPTLCAKRRPDIPYWPSTPSGGELPFHVASGTSHYFGVGAYRRPLEDARLARPRFMTECLAFANVPGEQGPDTTPRARVPRDRGTDWDFKMVTDYYVSVVFGDQARAWASRDPDLDAALCRATTAEVVERTQAVFRDRESGCEGALVWLHRDPWACAGWGIIDADGRPKSTYYGLRRAWAPVAVTLLDDGLDGLRVAIHNDPDRALAGVLEITLLRIDGTRVRHERVPIRVPARSSFAKSVDALLGGFVDSSHAYGFGPREFDLCVARFEGACEAVTGACSIGPIEAIHWPFELGLIPSAPVDLTMNWLEAEEGVVILEIRATRFLQCVSLALLGGLPDDNFFHVAPDQGRRIRVTPTGARLTGTLSALNVTDVLEIPERLVVSTALAAGGFAL